LETRADDENEDENEDEDEDEDEDDGLWMTEVGEQQQQ